MQYGIGVTRAIDCPKTVVGRVIGKGGETIKSLQKQFGTSIQIDQSCNPCKITIAGPSHSTNACERAIIDIIEDRPHNMGGMGGFGEFNSVCRRVSASQCAYDNVRVS